MERKEARKEKARLEDTDDELNYLLTVCSCSRCEQAKVDGIVWKSVWDPGYDTPLNIMCYIDYIEELHHKLQLHMEQLHTE